MHFSPPSLHPPAIKTHAEKAKAQELMEAVARRKWKFPAIPPAPAPKVVVPITTVSTQSNFDAYINIHLTSQGDPTALLLDSGNSNLIVPYWEAIQNEPGYTVIGEGREPFGSPAKVVRGSPWVLGKIDGADYGVALVDCVFFACTGAPRTANFGLGCVTPWSANQWSVPTGLGVTLQAPLSYSRYYYVELQYAAASAVLSAGHTVRVDATSQLVLYASSPPAGYTVFDIIQNLEWMSLVPKNLAIGTTTTGWPGTVQSPIAMIDTGGGPVFLSDPNGYVYQLTWPHPVTCPTWTSSSELCTCVSDDLLIELGAMGGNSSYKYAIRASDLPTSAQGLTGVLCKKNSYMQGQQGMNIGGISALFNDILINYHDGQVGFKPRRNG